MTKKQYLFLLLALILASCDRTYRLSEEDYAWMPYKGNETLVFKSNAGDTDTIFLLKKSTMLAYPDPLSLNGAKYEVLSVSCRHSDQYTSSGQHRYLEGTFFEVKKSMDRRAEIAILLAARDACFYRLSRIKTDSLSKVKPIFYAGCNDVYIIDPEDYSGNFHERSDYITKLYWSRSKGLIRYDKKDNIYWELQKAQ